MTAHTQLLYKPLWLHLYLSQQLSIPVSRPHNVSTARNLGAVFCSWVSGHPQERRNPLFKKLLSIRGGIQKRLPLLSWYLICLDSGRSWAGARSCCEIMSTEAWRAQKTGLHSTLPHAPVLIAFLSVILQCFQVLWSIWEAKCVSHKGADHSFAYSLLFDQLHSCIDLGSTMNRRFSAQGCTMYIFRM